MDEGRIEFVTFHPSYSYEEFVEGFRYNEGSGKPTRHDGIFLDLVHRASKGVGRPVARDDPRVWKVTLGRESEFVERAIANKEISIGWLEDQDLAGMDSGKIRQLFIQRYGDRAEGYKSINHFVNGIREGD